VKQLIDLALLANGQLKGKNCPNLLREALSLCNNGNVLKRPVPK